ncbi:MAG: hypothetical protein KF838_14355 [Phycisphaeraceae bacterium]|nr:MAG: hypothetical protein KF838_14355 [Phycisphaeraceae bacterium]
MHQIAIITLYIAALVGCTVVEIVIDRRAHGTHDYSNLVIGACLLAMLLAGVGSLIYALLIIKHSIPTGFDVSAVIAVAALFLIDAGYGIWRFRRIATQ